MPRLILFLITIVIHHNVAVSGESPINGYSHNAENSGYDHSNSLTNEKYLTNENEYRTVPNSYLSVSQRNQYSSLGGGSQMSTTTNSYNGFPAYGHGNRLSAYSTIPHEGAGSNSFSMGSLSSTSSEGHSTGSNVAKSTFDGYSSIVNHEDPESNQYTNNNNYQRPQHVGYYTDLSGQSSATNYNGNTLRTPAFEAYVGHSYHDAASYSPSTYSSTLQNNDYAFGKQKDNAQETGSSNKHENEIFIGASDIRYPGGNFGGGHTGYNHGYTSTRSPGSNFYLASIPGNSQSSSTVGKGNKHNFNKYMTNYIFATGTNYSPKNHENNYTPETYVKNNGRIIIIKESSPIKYTGSAHSNGPVYSSNVPGIRSYKSKASNFMSSHGAGYPSSSMFSTVPTSSTSSSSSSSGSSNSNYDTSYAGSHSPRGYINNRGHMNHEHTNVFSSYP